MAKTRAQRPPVAAIAAEVQPGEILGNYRILRRLGAGGMGEVHLAEHALIGRRVAIKILLPQVSHDDEIVQRFFNEAQIASALDHPGIVQVFDFGYRADGRAYIVMEYLDGESLAARIARRGRLSVDESLRIAHQCANALSVAHRRGVVHRDIKPDNIFILPDPLVDGGERAKLLDFGIAKLVGPERRGGFMTRAGVVMGTPVYMAPEQCSGAGDIDQRADVYALGCVLFHLLCGRPPFEGPGSIDIMAAHLREPAPVPSTLVPDIPAAVDAIVARCLAKAPDARFASMAELDAAITAAAPSITPHHLAAVAPTMVGPDAVVSTPPGLAPPPVPALHTPGAPRPITTLGGAAGQSQPAHGSSRLVRKALLPGALIAVATAIGLALVISYRQTPPEPVDEATTAASPGATATEESPAPTAPPTAPGRPDDGPAAVTPSVAPTPDASAEITVRIESVPPGASVFLPGADAPVGVTPYEYRTLPSAEPMTVRLALDGYQAADATFDRDQSRVVTTALTRSEPETQVTPGQTSDERPPRAKPRRKPKPKDDDELEYR